MKTILIVLSMTVLILSGCAVDQQKEVQTYRRVLDANQPQQTRPFDANDPLTLKQALVIANTHNQELAMSGEDYLQALINEDRAFARFLPTIGLAPTYLRQKKTSLGAGNNLITQFVPDRALDVPVNGEMTVAPWIDVPARRGANAIAAQQRAQLLERRAVVLLDVAQTYYQVLRSESEVTVLAHSIGVLERNLADTRTQQVAGVARDLDVARVQARLAATRASRIQAQNDVKNGRAMLALLLGIKAVEGPLTDAFTVPDSHWSLDGLIKQAETHRQDLRAVRARVAVAAVRLQAAWGEYYPSVSLHLDQYLSRQSFPSDVDWTALIKVQVPLFSAGLVHDDVRTAYSQLRQAHQAEDLVRQQILKDLRSARANLSDVDRRLEQLTIEVTAARQSLHQSEAAYDAGTATSLERNTTQDRLLQAQLDQTSARYARNVDYLRLLRATGCLDTTLALSPIPTQINGTPPVSSPSS